MQYILTKQEYDDLVNMGRKEADRLKSILMDLCTKVADHMPIEDRGWNPQTPWICIKSVAYEHRCDKCPVKNVCPEEFKRYSK